LLMFAPGLLIPGDDPAHSMSATHYLCACLPR
jgi:hypothetical protein